jgi:Fe-S-cluster-containing dehydrogenase component/formate-dependent nitrite reductase membrane component NrfD
MQYGFVIDNRKCIGCHACTVACKSEHDVPIGVNRTWVKQVEKGVFPNTRRVFSVMRCNHCTDAPCVTICPTQALFVREDGIVDFDNRRCIGCKGCMQACPYDALYIDPETNTAAKCNYCAHRIDVGLEPSCVNVCPEHAIISGNLDNPNSEIAQLLAREQISVRKPEKYTGPNVYYIDGDKASLSPSETERSENYLWNSQSAGVGHFSRFAEQKRSDLPEPKMQGSMEGGSITTSAPKSIDLLMGKARRVYDTPDKGLLWGKEVVAYVVTKAISAGIPLAFFLAWFFSSSSQQVDLQSVLANGLIVSFVFLTLTLILLVMDLDQPKRFLYVLLRPQWKSWLVRGGYILMAFSLVLILGIVDLLFISESTMSPVFWNILLYAGTPLAVGAAVYTAFLFAQSRGRDFWQSPVLILHMLVHSLIAGSAVLILLSSAALDSVLYDVLIWSLIGNLLVTASELLIPHPTHDTKKVVSEILNGSYSRLFWGGSILLGAIIPLIMLFLLPQFAAVAWLPGVLALLGLVFTEKIWVEAPQRIPLS